MTQKTSLEETIKKLFINQQKVIDKRFEEQSLSFERRFKEQSSNIDKRFEEQAVGIDKRFEEQSLSFERRFKEQSSNINRRFKEQSTNIDKRFEVFLEGVKSLVKITIQETLEEEQVVTRKDIKHLPNKDEFYESQAKLMKEVKDMREEQSAHMGLHDRIEKKFNRIEKHLHLANR